MFYLGNNYYTALTGHDKVVISFSKNIETGKCCTIKRKIFISKLEHRKNPKKKQKKNKKNKRKGICI